MFRDIFEAFAYVFEYFILFYSIAIVTAYLALAVVSGIILIGYQKRNSYVDYRRLLSSPFVPSISVIAPAHNEEGGILEATHSLLSLQYPKLEVVVVNDGSTDKTLDTLKERYRLELVDFAINPQVPCHTIKGVYRSNDPTYPNLVVVDKETGGTKSDAMNAGINVATGKLLLDIDADSVLEQDTLLKMVKPFMEQDKKVIGVGGVLGIANECKVEDGKLVEVEMPKKFFPRIQTIEYLRSFLCGRMAWSRISGIIIISGALGLFDRRALIAAGGFDPKAYADDMETGVRLRRFMHDDDKDYEMVYIPEPLCWTEVPYNLKTFFAQRTRWGSSILQTLWKHKGVFFNPKYGGLGLIGFPFAVFFEWLAPFLEILGLTYFIIAAILGIVNWDVFLLLLASIYTITIFLSTLALLYEELSYHPYTKKGHLFKWFGSAFLEPLLFHPVNAFSMIKGSIDFMTGRHSWQSMEREGLGKRKSKAAA